MCQREVVDHYSCLLISNQLLIPPLFLMRIVSDLLLVTFKIVLCLFEHKYKYNTNTRKIEFYFFPMAEIRNQEMGKRTEMGLYFYSHVFL